MKQTATKLSIGIALARAAITKCHRLGGLTNKHWFLRVLEDGKSKIKMLVDLVSSESPLCLQKAIILGPHLAFPWYIHIKSYLVSLSLFIRVLIPSWSPCLCDQTDSNYIPKALPPNTITLDIRASPYEFWGDTNIQSIPGIHCEHLFVSYAFASPLGFGWLRLYKLGLPPRCKLDLVLCHTSLILFKSGVSRDMFFSWWKSGAHFHFSLDYLC